jgi:penicillin-binding protein 1C
MLRLAPIEGLEDFESSYYSIPLYSSQKNLLAILPLEEGLRRQFISIDDFSDELSDIILQSEDKRFYFHPGFDPISLLRAGWQYMRTGEIDSGASTITMQLIRMIHPRTKGIESKLLEILDALKLETRYTKRKILEAYINHLPFGSNIEGIESAAYYFLGKEAGNLSREELLILIMIPRRPETFNPLENVLSNKAALQRTIPRLRKKPLPEEIERVYEILADHHPQWPSSAPHFVQMIREGLDVESWQRGIPLYTSLDEEFQKGAQSYLSDIISITGENRISNGAVLAVENSTGNILAYLGSADFNSEDNQGQIDGVRIIRQPGSTLKPFLYAKALESGYSLSAILPDIPMEFGHREIYIPENYNERYNGPVRLSVALGSSLNVPAVYLLEQIGVKSFLSKLLSCGFKSLEGKESLGVGLALGNGEVSLWELVQAFSIFSRNGEYLPLGYDFNSMKIQPEAVFPPVVSEMIRHILSNNKNRILGFGRNSPLDVEFDAYFKTGTSNQFNNIWAVGASQDMTVGVWMGNFSGETVIGSPGSSYPARVVVSLLEDFHRVDSFTSDIPFLEREICSLSGDLAGSECLYTIKEQFPADQVLETCRWHREGRTFLPSIYSRWSQLYRQDFEIDSSQSQLEIVQPKDGALFYLDPTIKGEFQSLPIRISGNGMVSLYINDKLVHKGSAPFDFFHDVKKGFFLIKAISAGNEEEVGILVK